MRYKPHNYQNEMSSFIRDNPFCGVFAEMGLGKTVATLTALKDVKLLVISKKHIIENTWPSEIAKWDHLKHLKYVAVKGTPKQRAKALEQSGDVYGITVDNVFWLVEELGPKWTFDTVILDESSLFKNPSSKRFKAFKRVRKKMKRLVLLSGTPQSNTIADLWAQIFLLDGGERLGKSFTAFRSKYFYPLFGNGTVVYQWGLLDYADEDIKAKIKDICISLQSKDYLELPPVIYNNISIKIDKYDRYKALEKDMLLGTNITAGSAGVLANKLLQLASGAVYKDDSKEAIVFHNSKIEKLKEIIETNNNVLVFYGFKHDKERILQAIPEARTLEYSEDIAAWNAGDIPVLLAHPASAGHGINLQAGGNVIVWFSLTWNLENYLQANARLYRQGQEKTVIVHHLIAEKTIDEEVYARLQSKKMDLEGLMESLKKRLEGLEC